MNNGHFEIIDCKSDPIQQLNLLLAPPPPQHNRNNKIDFVVQVNDETLNLMFKLICNKKL